MKIPKQINVLGEKWIVRYKWNLSDEGVRCDGLCSYKDKTIYIDRSTQATERPQIFLHELFHALIYRSNIGEDLISSDVEEILVEALSMYLTEKFDIKLKKPGKKK